MNPRRDPVQHPGNRTHVASVAVHADVRSVQTSCFLLQFAHAFASGNVVRQWTHPRQSLFLRQRSQFLVIFLGAGEGNVYLLSLQALVSFRVPTCRPTPPIDDSTCACSRLVNTRMPSFSETEVRQHGEHRKENSGRFAAGHRGRHKGLATDGSVQRIESHGGLSLGLCRSQLLNVTHGRWG